MSVTVYVATSDPALSKGRAEAAQKVLEYFGDVLPELDLKVLLDSAEWYELREGSGEENRGVFYRVNAHTFEDANWPYHLRDQLATVDAVTLNLKFTCNAAVYLHDSTCQNLTALTMTLSHELQHWTNSLLTLCLSPGGKRRSLLNLPEELGVTTGFQIREMRVKRQGEIRPMSTGLQLQSTFQLLR